MVRVWDGDGCQDGEEDAVARGNCGELNLARFRGDPTHEAPAGDPTHEAPI
eukprot:SAG31_NODE_46092_length_256_cov_0.630573_1_plen_50_part_01